MVSVIKKLFYCLVFFVLLANVIEAAQSTPLCNEYVIPTEGQRAQMLLELSIMPDDAPPVDITAMNVAQSDEYKEIFAMLDSMIRPLCKKLDIDIPRIFILFTKSRGNGAIADSRGIIFIEKEFIEKFIDDASGDLGVKHRALTWVIAHELAHLSDPLLKDGKFWSWVGPIFFQGAVGFLLSEFLISSCVGQWSLKIFACALILPQVCKGDPFIFPLFCRYSEAYADKEAARIIFDLFGDFYVQDAEEALTIKHALCGNESIVSNSGIFDDLRGWYNRMSRTHPTSSERVKTLESYIKVLKLNKQ